MHCFLVPGVLVSLFSRILLPSHSICLPDFQAPPAYLQINVMASLRKKLSMALGLNSEASSSASKNSSMHRKRNSIDSGYHSMIAKPECGNSDSDSQAATFVTSDTEGSPEHSPRKLHKAMSSTFSGAMQAFSNTVRATTSYIYPTTGEPELPSSEWAECETPKKESRQSSVMSSLRSRRRRFTPRASSTKIEFLETQPSPVPRTPDESPALDVEIPNSSLNYEHLGKVSVSSGLQLLAGVKLPPGAKNLWPGPTRLTSEQQISGNSRQRIPHSLLSKIDDPYVEQKDTLQHDLFMASSSQFDLELTPAESNKRYMSDDKGYLSEAESNAETSGADELSPAIFKNVALGSPETRKSLSSHHKKPAASHVRGASSASPSEKTISSRHSAPLESKPSKPEDLDGTAEETTSWEPPNRRFSRQSFSLEDSLNALSPEQRPAITSKSKSLSRQLSSDVYDADVEILESGMGSRAVWECNRADRDRRYKQIFHAAPDTESDNESNLELELKRSPSREPVHYAEGPVQSKTSVEGSQPASVYPASDLRYAVEAIERRSFPVDDSTCAVEAAKKPALPKGDLPYAVEAIDRPSITTFEPLETVYQQRPMLRLSDTVDERESLPRALESTVTTKKLTNEEHMTLGAEMVEGKSIRQRSSEPTDVTANSSLKNQSHTPSKDIYEAGTKAESLSVPTYVSISSPVGDDARLAGLRATHTFKPIFCPDAVQKYLVEDRGNEDNTYAVSDFPPIPRETSRSTYREILEAGSTLQKQGLPNGTHFEHRRTVTGWTDNTDDSGATTPDSPSSKAPPPFPSLLVQSEPACCIPNAVDAIAIHGHDKIRVSGLANVGIIPSLPSPFDYPDQQTNKAGLKSSSPIASEGANPPEKCAQATSSEHYDPQGPSPGTTSSTQARSNRNTPKRTFNAAQLPSFGSPSPIASRKARRKQRKSSNRTTNSTCQDLEPYFSLLEIEPNKNSASSRRSTSTCGSVMLAQGSAQKPSPNHSIGKKYQKPRDQLSLEELAEIAQDAIRLSNSTLKSQSSTKNPCSEGADPTTLTSSPPRMKLPRLTSTTSSDELRDHAECAINVPESRHEPRRSSINCFDSTNNDFSLHASGGQDGTSYASHEQDSVVQEKSPSYSYQHSNEDLQQEGDSKAESCASGDETIGRDRKAHINAPRTPHQKKSSTPAPEAAKMSSVQRELEKRSDRPCSRLAGKLKNGALADVHVHEDKLTHNTHKDGRPPWRP